jgi:hypothetical protein
VSDTTSDTGRSGTTALLTEERRPASAQLPPKTPGSTRGAPLSATYHRKTGSFIPAASLRFSFKSRSGALRPFKGAGRGEREAGEGPPGDGSVVSYNLAASPEEQEGVIAEMMKLTRRLPPRTPLDVRGLPLVHMARPMRLAGDLVPSERASGGSASAFIYNPFADKGGGGTVTWAAGEVSHVALLLSNPLGAPLHVQGIELLMEADGEGEEGAEEGAGAPAVFCYPLTLWVPAHRRFHPLMLALKPLRKGGLTLRGVRLTVFNITSEVLVDANGDGPRSEPRCAPRDWYHRRVPYTRAPKGEKQLAGPKPPVPDGAVPTNRIAVVDPLPWLTTRLDKWATNVELFPGEYRRVTLELQVCVTWR